MQTLHDLIPSGLFRLARISGDPKLSFDLGTRSCHAYHVYVPETGTHHAFVYRMEFVDGSLGGEIEGQWFYQAHPEEAVISGDEMDRSIFVGTVHPANAILESEVEEEFVGEVLRHYHPVEIEIAYDETEDYDLERFVAVEEGDGYVTGILNPHVRPWFIDELIRSRLNPVKNRQRT